VAAHALATAGDNAAVPQLLADLSSPEQAARLHAAQDLLRLNATLSPALTRQRFDDEPDPEVRSTLAIIRARQGDETGISTILKEFKGQPKESNPFLPRLMNEVTVRGPFPESTRATVRDYLAGGDPSQSAGREWWIRLIDVSEPAMKPAPPIPSGWKPWPWRPRYTPAPTPAVEAILQGNDPDLVHTLDRETVGQIVTTLTADAVAEPGTIGANDVLELVWVRPDFVADIPKLFRFFRALTAADYSGPEIVPMQLAWVLSRVGLRYVVDGLQGPLTAPDPRERLAAADLVELVAIYTGYSEPPYLIGGLGAGGARPTVQEATSELVAESRARKDSEEILRRPRTAARAEIEAAAPPPPAPFQRASPPPPAPPRPVPAVASPRAAPKAGRPSIGDRLVKILGRLTPGFGNFSVAGPQAPPDRVSDPPRTAYALVECPPVVAAQTEFELKVGIAPQQSAGVIGDVLERPETSVGEYVLTAQVVAGGFSIKSGESWRMSLAVTAEHPYPSAALHLTADQQVARVLPRTIQVLYSIGGQTIGAAFRPLAVVSDASIVAETASPPPAPGVDIGLPTAKTACDLTVRISIGEAENILLFTFDGPGIATSPEPIRRNIGDSPDLFARQLVDKVNLKEGQAGSYDLLLGFGKTVADVLPPQFWEALRLVREKVPDRPPTVLLLSQEPYVPWELAVMPPPLIDPGAPPFLGAQADVGRWVLGPRVKVPPPAEIRVDAAAVIWGIYNQPGWQRLVEAEDEAARIEKQYGAVSVTASTVEVLSCFKGTPPADLIHFAVHGIYDPTGVQDGLVLTDGAVLDPMEVRGSDLTAAPFVFLNACQVGSGNKILGDYAGMAAAFLYAGASGVVAPLWSVKDSVAKEIALDFYAKTSAGSRPSDVFRRERGVFSADSSKSPTYMAYQFFGHPNMELIWKRVEVSQ